MVQLTSDLAKLILTLNIEKVIETLGSGQTALASSFLKFSN